MTNPFADQGGEDQLTEQATQDQTVLDQQDQSGLDDQSQIAAQDASQAPGRLAQTRTQAQDQLESVIDNLAGRVPGGEALAPRAKEASGGLLDSLEHAAEERLGGLFGQTPNTGN